MHRRICNSHGRPCFAVTRRSVNSSDGIPKMAMPVGGQRGNRVLNEFIFVLLLDVFENIERVDGIELAGHRSLQHVVDERHRWANADSSAA